jgi:lysophospholipase L1-like esterase
MKDGAPSTRAAAIANIALIKIGLLSLSFLVHFINRHGWSPEKHFTDSPGSILYYAVPTILATFCFAALRLSASVRINLAILFTSTTFLIYGLETLLASTPSLLKPRNIKQARLRAARESGIGFDKRTKLQVVADLAKTGLSAVPEIAPAFVLLKPQRNGSVESELTIEGREFLPLVGIANKPTVFCNETGEYLIYTSDDHGFHNPKGIWSAGPIDIAALGDSFTQGECVRSNQNFVALIRQDYPATLNLGSSGSGPLATLAILKEYLQSMKPKTVLWFYFEGNDLSDLRREKRSPLLMQYVESNFSQRLIVRQDDIDRLFTDYVENAARTRLAEQAAERQARREEATEISAVFGKRFDRLVRQSGELVLLDHVRQQLGLIYESHRHERERETSSSEAEIDLFGRILSRAKTHVEGWGGSLCFVYLPTWARYGDPPLQNRDRERVLALARSLQLPVIDVHQAFQAQEDPLEFFPFRLQGHYNDAGHRWVAKTVLRSISAGNRQGSACRPA